MLDPRAARVSMRRDARGARVMLRWPGTELEVGRHLDAAQRVELAAELAEKLRI